MTSEVNDAAYLQSNKGRMKHTENKLTVCSHKNYWTVIVTLL